jgi:hypothetical protein
MENIFSDLAKRVDDAITQSVALAAAAGMSVSTFGPIVEGVKKRVGMIEGRE